MTKSTPRKLRMESLETRKLMAGDVAVTIDNGSLIVEEAASDVGEDQQLQMFKLSNGMVRVQGLAGTKIQTPVLINGQQFTMFRNYADFIVNDDIRVDLGGGNDRISMLNYNGGIDADYVRIDTDGTGSDNDFVSVYGLSTTHELHINTGGGADQVSVSGSTIGDSTWEDLEIDTGAGADYVSVTTTTIADNLDVDMYLYASEADADKLIVDTVTADDLFADLGNGADEASIKYSNLDDVDLDMGYDHASYGQDADYVFLGFNNLDDVEIYGRDSNDTVRAAYNTADNVDFSGGSGVDEFYSWIEANGQNSNDFDDLDLFSASARTYGYV